MKQSQGMKVKLCRVFAFIKKLAHPDFHCYCNICLEEFSRCAPKPVCSTNTLYMHLQLSDFWFAIIINMYFVTGVFKNIFRTDTLIRNSG